MKRTKKLHGKGFYILEGTNAANTHLVENEKEIDQFLIFSNSYLRHFLDIYDYCITPTGWHLLIRVKSAHAVKKAYKSIQRNRNNKATLESVSLIVSNQVRLFRFRMTRWTNKRRGRKGNASRQVYQRYILDSLEEGIAHIKQVRNQEIDLDQPVKKYKASPDNFQIKDTDIDVRSKMSSKTNQEKTETGRIHLKCLKVCDYVVDFLEIWILETIRMHQIEYERSGMVRR